MDAPQRRLRHSNHEETNTKKESPEQVHFSSQRAGDIYNLTSRDRTALGGGGLGRRANVQTLIDENKTPPSDKHSHTRALSYTHACTYRLLPALSALHQREELHLFPSQFFIIEGAKETQHFLFTSSAAFSLTLSFSFLRL